MCNLYSCQQAYIDFVLNDVLLLVTIFVFTNMYTLFTLYTIVSVLSFNKPLKPLNL